MTSQASTDREALAITAALLGQGRYLHATAVALTVAGVLAAAVQPSSTMAAAAGICICILAIETYFAVRVGHDARLLLRMEECARSDALDLVAFDKGLAAAGLASARHPTRGLTERLRGALRLFKRQAALVALIMGTLACSAFVHWRLA